MQSELKHNQSARISLDLIAALAIFIVGLIYVVTTMNTMFNPYQTETVDTQAVAYRASVMLVEDEGVNESGRYRAGLAISYLQPNFLHYYKLYELRSLNYTQLRDSLGLYRIVNGKKVYYDCNIRVTSLDGSETLLQAGKPVPISGDVSSITREVYVMSNQYSTANALVVPFPGTPASNDKVLIGVVGWQRMDVGFRMINMTFEGGVTPKLMDVKQEEFDSWDEMLARSSNPSGGPVNCSKYAVWTSPTTDQNWTLKDSCASSIVLSNNSDMQLLFNKSLFQDPVKGEFGDQFYLIELKFSNGLATTEATPWLWNLRAGEGGFGNAKITIMVW